MSGALASEGWKVIFMYKRLSRRHTFTTDHFQFQISPDKSFICRLENRAPGWRFDFVFRDSIFQAGRPGSSEVHRHPLTRWDVSSIPANGIFLTKKLKNENKNAQRVEND